jgi:hypothetical protein
MDMPSSFCHSVRNNHHQEPRKMTTLILKYIAAHIRLAGIEIRRVALGAIVFLTSCAHPTTGAPTVSKVTSHIDSAYNNLSAADGKAVLIESWLKESK